MGKALRFANDQAGFAQLLDRLSAVGEIALIGLEATGHYWLALYSALAEAGYNLGIRRWRRLATTWSS
ncbi:MAG: transposase [Anaerolineae bacterium]